MIIETLDDADIVVSTFQQCLKRGTSSWKNAPALVKRIIREDCWRKRIVQATGKEVTFKHFEEFVIADIPDGLEANLDVLKALCKDDKDALDAIDGAVKRKKGPKKIDNVNLLTSAPDGNSEQAAIRRLRKDRPDLLDKVKSGDLSAHAAMVQAGFREPSLTIPADPVKAARRLLKHFQGDSLATLIEELRRG